MVISPFFLACPSTNTTGPQNRWKGQEAEHRLHWIWHLRRRVQQKEETNSKELTKGYRTLIPTTAPERPQECQALGSTSLQLSWRKNKNRIVGYHPYPLCLQFRPGWVKSFKIKSGLYLYPQLQAVSLGQEPSAFLNYAYHNIWG